MSGKVLGVAGVAFFAVGLSLSVPAGGAGATTPVTATASAPGGLNDWHCHPSALHPNPVVMVHGLGSTGSENWSYLGPRLAGAGYCVFTPTYGLFSPFPFGGITRVDQSAHELAGDIDQVLAATGATQVDLVGHSEGGFQVEYIPKVLGYGPKIHTVVAIAPPTRGASFGGIPGLGQQVGLTGPIVSLLAWFGCGACEDLLPGGPAVRQLNEGPVSVPGVDYTVIASNFDLLIFPSTAFIYEPGVHNVLVQDICPTDPVGHIGEAFDSGVGDIVANALDPLHPQGVACTFGLPF
jgi:triacylglycerol esterase/lipase EstA (alpha/beta hydrolase family)